MRLNGMAIASRAALEVFSPDQFKSAEITKKSVDQKVKS
jgi:hypothetical protein